LTERVEAQLTETLVQVPPGNAGRIRLRPTVHEPYVLLLKKSTSAMSTGKLWNKNCRQTTPVSLLGSIVVLRVDILRRHFPFKRTAVLY
jgi:hypothetical protein